MEDEDIGALAAPPPGKPPQHQAHKGAAQHRQEEKAGSQHNAHSDGPEEEGDVHGFLNGGAEPDDGQGAHHTQGEHHVAGHRQDQQGGDQRQGDEGYPEAGGVHHAAVALLIDQKDEQAQ